MADPVDESREKFIEKFAGVVALPVPVPVLSNRPPVTTSHTFLDLAKVEEPTQCAFCKSNFKKAGNLKRHLVSSHNIAEDRIFYGCTRCPSRFSTKKQMTRHKC